MKINVIMTCYNRKDKTLRCIKKLLTNCLDIHFTIVDDNSTDGTTSAIEELNINKKILRGNGNLFWAGGMRLGIEDCLKEIDNYDYVLLVNDDVDFFQGSIEHMLGIAAEKTDSVIVGACCDMDGNPTYGAVKLNGILSRKMYRHLSIKENDVCADTFNCNAVLIPSDIMKIVGNFDNVYTHNFADYDYGFMLRKAGYGIYITPNYVGVCSDDKSLNTWENHKLTRSERLKLKEMAKGLPQKEWNHFLLKNLGFSYFIRYAYSAKIKILLGF